MSSKFINSLAVKLNVASSKVIRKAEELQRLWDVRISSGAANLNLSETCRAVMCLDLAADCLGEHLDKSMVIKISGCKRVLYMGSIQTLRKLLTIESSFTLRDLVVQFGTDGTETLARQILEEYEAHLVKEFPAADHKEMLSKPLYITAVFYAACCKSKKKVDKKKLMELSGANKATFDNLTLQLQKLANNMQVNQPTKTAKRPRTVMELVEAKIKEQEENLVVQDEEEVDSEEESSRKNKQYLEWKQRVLQSTAGKQ